MAALMCLAIILHFSAVCDSIGIREIYFNDSETVKDKAVPSDLNEHRDSDVNSTQNHESNDRRQVSRLGATEPVYGDNATDGNNTLREDSHTANNDMVTIDIDDTTSNITYNNHRFELPKEWLKFCHIGEGRVYSSEFTSPVNLTEIKCNVTPDYSGVWEMSVLRQHLALYESSNFKYSVDIRCHSWSNISLSWPIKIANLYFLTVQHCQIKDFLAEFDQQLLQTTPDSLRVLNLSDNKVLVATDTYLNITMNVSNILPEYNCGHDETLESLSLRNISYGFIDSVDFVFNRLTELGAKFILDAKRRQQKCDYKHLMHLDESQSASMSVYHMELKESIFYELKVYNISYNYIKVLKDIQLQWSVSFPKLEMYDLSHNQISKLHRFELPLHTSLDRVTTINLQYNKITSIAVEDLERFKQMPMVFIDLRNNPIQCNCTENMKQLLAYVREQNYLDISNLSDYSYIKDLECVWPERLQSRTLESITDLDQLCVVNVEKEYFLVPILILSVTIVVLSAMLFALLRYRKEVLIILFTRFNIIIPCHQRHSNDDSSKKYDAFVSYSSTEEEWVESLFENLELQLINGNRHFRFCLHHRDFIPGKTIYDNVIKSVESSRHTIILLSNSFLKSEFCLYEFQEAFRQSIMEQRRHLVIVMMEELDTDKLPRDLRRCIQTFTYIKKDDYLFRERLIYALSVKQKSQMAESKGQKNKHSSSTSDKNKTKISTSSKKSSRNENINFDKSAHTNSKVTFKSNGKLSKVTQNQQISQHSDHRDKTCTEKLENNHKYSDNSYKTQSAKIEETCENLQTDIRHNVKVGKTDKCLALNIESDAGIPLSELESYRCTASIDMTKTNDNCIDIDEDMTTRTTDYDRSMSTLSHDTGYFSEKGSPDICSQECASFDKNIFPNEIDITDVEV